MTERETREGIVEHPVVRLIEWISEKPGVALLTATEVAEYRAMIEDQRSLCERARCLLDGTPEDAEVSDWLTDYNVTFSKPNAQTE